MQITATDVDRVFAKLELEEPGPDDGAVSTSTGRRRGYLRVDGLRVLVLTCDSGGEPLPGQTADNFRRSMRLSPREFDQFVECTLSRERYVSLLSRRSS
ncbi:MAG: hypothetical protein AAGD33_06070 [Actinomycetota bacterium]